MIDQKTKNRVLFSFTDDQLRDALRDIFRHFGYDPALLTVAQKKHVAERLSELAGKSPSWTYLYVHNFMFNNLQAGQGFKESIIKLASIIDDTPIALVQSHAVSIQAIGNVMPGSFVYGDSKRCANPSCGNWFVSDIWNKHTCSENCSRQYAKWKRKQARNG
jgi:hypothetical protein